MNKKIIGIDPGQKGAIAVITDSRTQVFNMPETPLDIFNLLGEQITDNTVVYIENVGHGIPGQSSSATAKFARHNGHLEMALIALKVKTIYATPQKWQRQYQLGKSSDYSKHEWKNKLKAKAQQLFPNIKVTLANADALLIAEYGNINER